ncbi:TrmB family transcriptional regulator [Halosimplex aquaticum]|uniref:TrmB family transcriptional regulator n=1 Tax=Halosimplex aquaticum TaxID=3026162 RepID=A0ABD5XX90_9EURY|nr:helix-turn-helix domain-containing protein [Halosimplex aquaticum]
MDDISNTEQAIELLQGLGLKEYEAKAFVALTRLPHATAKEISDISEVPRTRVYDAVRVLETKGLVEIQHANPQQFRAVGIDEAAETLRAEYESKTETLRERLRAIEPASADSEPDSTHEVWALTGRTAAGNRAKQLLGEAEREIVIVLGNDAVTTESLLEALAAAQRRGVTLVVGTVSEALRDRVENAVPDAEVFVSGLEWLHRSEEDDTEITRIMLVDRSTILVSTAHDAPGADVDEQAVFGRGFDNGFVTIARRLMATGLLPVEDPGID